MSDYTTKQEATINYSDLDTLKEGAPDFEQEAHDVWDAIQEAGQWISHADFIAPDDSTAEGWIAQALRSTYERGFEECRGKAAAEAFAKADFCKLCSLGEYEEMAKDIAEAIRSLTPGEDG